MRRSDMPLLVQPWTRDPYPHYQYLKERMGNLTNTRNRHTWRARRAHLSSPYYPIPQQGSLFTENVSIFRGSEELGFPFQEPYRVNVVSAAAISFGHKRNKLPEWAAQQMKKKVDAIIAPAVHSRQQILVLSAFGCGAYNNPADEVAAIMIQRLHAWQWWRHFAVVAFAIKTSGPGKEQRNHSDFSRVSERYHEWSYSRPWESWPNGFM